MKPFTAQIFNNPQRETWWKYRWNGKNAVINKNVLYFQKVLSTLLGQIL